MWSATLFVLLDAHLTSYIQHKDLFTWQWWSHSDLSPLAVHTWLWYALYIWEAAVCLHISEWDKIWTGWEKKGKLVFGHRHGSHRWQQRTYGGHATIDRQAERHPRSGDVNRHLEGPLLCQENKKRKAISMEQTELEWTFGSSRLLAKKQRWTEMNLKLKVRFSQKLKISSRHLLGPMLMETTEEALDKDFGQKCVESTLGLCRATCMEPFHYTFCLFFFFLLPFPQS